MMLIICFLLLNLCAVLEGVIHGILYSRQGADSFTWNEHVLFIIGRGTYLVLLHFGMYIGYAEIGFLIPAFLCSFSFFHNGVYNYTKAIIFDRLNKTKSNFFECFTSTLKTSTANIQYDFPARATLFGFSVILITIGYLVL